MQPKGGRVFCCGVPSVNSSVQSQTPPKKKIAPPTLPSSNYYEVTHVCSDILVVIVQVQSSKTFIIKVTKPAGTRLGPIAGEFRRFLIPK
jgi:hypothetical protein